MIVFTFVFSFIFRLQPQPGNPSGLDSFPLWLLAGLLPWSFFARSIALGSNSIVSNESLITKVYFPRIVLPASDVFSASYNWLFEMGLLIVVVWIVGGLNIQMIPLTLFAMILLMIFSMGIGFLLSISNAYFRDTEYLVSVLLQIFIYLSPVVYPITLVKEWSNSVGNLFNSNISVYDIYMLNPMAQFIELFRTIIYDGGLPSASLWLTTSCLSLLSLLLGTYLFSRKDKRLAEIL